MAKQENIKDKAREIMKVAKNRGIDDDPFFRTTYHSLMVQIDMMGSLEQAYKEDGATITKEYVKGRENVYIHPSVEKYSKISDSAVKKIAFLMEMIDKRKPKDEEEGEFTL